MDKVINFDPPVCVCNRFSIRKIDEADKFKYELLNIEFSLACQATCAMCCVKAPELKGAYSHDDRLEKLIVNLVEVDKVVSQGGEVLIQKKYWHL